MQIKPNNSPVRNTFLALLLSDIGHLFSRSRSCLGRLIFLRGGWGSLQAKLPTRVMESKYSKQFCSLNVITLCGDFGKCRAGVRLALDHLTVTWWVEIQFAEK